MPHLIEIKGYKSIKASRVTLNALNVLIGANGAGKSNFISVFDLLRRLAESNLELYVPASGGADAFLLPVFVCEKCKRGP